MKSCSKCKLEKDEAEFNFNRVKGKLEYHCKVCHSAYLKAHYKNNKDYYKTKSQVRVASLRGWLDSYKSTLKCELCDENHPACLDFHHMGNKILEISEVIAHGWKKERILEEISKCRVYCANCHRKHHWETKTGPWQNKSEARQMVASRLESGLLLTGQVGSIPSVSAE